uniref:recombinase family protein n=1 Tax=Eubacterium sp. TaxID=142586 RepID=UPI004026FA41
EKLFGGVNMFNQRTSIKSFNPYDFLDRNRERKVVFYGRVSTEHEAQISALGNQIQWYDEQAKNHSNWTIIDKYIDEGITGTQAKKRPAFLKMIDDAKEKRFDLIVTREVCRFARNTVDTLVTTRELKNIGIEVYFVEDNIWTMDGDGELRLSLMATLAQEESRKVSERVKAGQQISREKATLYGSGNILGYDRCGKSYVINEEQAETVRLIYNMYMNDGIGTMKIANKLIEMHKLNASGVVKWTAATINRILNNKTYAGYVVYGKSYSNNYLEQRRVNNYDTSTYMYAKGDFEPIISEEVWNKCQEIKKNRVTSCFGTTVNGKPKNHGKIESKDVWVKKLKCSCGASFRKNRWHKNKNCDWSYGYQCYNQLNNGSAKQRRLAGEDDEGYCDQRMIADWKLELMAKMVFEEVWKNHTDCISETIKIIKRCYRENKVENNQKNSIMFQIEKIKSKKNILLDMRTSGEITKDEFLEQKEVLNKKLSLLESELKNCFEIDTKQIQIDYDEILKSLNEIVDFSNPKMDRELLQRFIAKVVPNGENHFIWYLNLDGKSDTRLNVNIVGNKKNAIVSIDESGDISPLHTSDILYFNDEKSFTVETLHRLLLQKWTNFYIALYNQSQGHFGAPVFLLYK